MATRKKPVTRRDHSSMQTFLEYNCLVSGQILVDEVCPWHAVDYPFGHLLLCRPYPSAGDLVKELRIVQ